MSKRAVPKPAHIWFDIDNTLYRMSEELEARIFNSMYEFVVKHHNIALEEVTVLYDKLYRQTDSHTATFERLGLPADGARKAYNLTNIADHVQPDPALVRMFDYFNKLGIPCSVYSNNYARTIDAVLTKLGIDAPDSQRIVFKIAGESFPKRQEEPGYKWDSTETDSGKYKSGAGFKRIVELSTSHAGRDLNHSEILFVGDRERLDIKPAKKMGMSAALVCWKADVSSIESAADFKLTDIYQLGQVVESLVR